MEQSSVGTNLLILIHNTTKCSKTPWRKKKYMVVKCTVTTYCTIQSSVQIRYHTTICSPGHHNKKMAGSFPLSSTFLTKESTRLQLFFLTFLIAMNQSWKWENISDRKKCFVVMVPSSIWSDVLFSFKKVSNHFKGPIFKSYTINSKHDCTNIQLIRE